MALQLEKYIAGKFLPGAGYKFFLPNSINEQWQWNDPQLNTLLEKASIRLGELNSYSLLVPNIDLFIQLHVTKEAVVSSRIEGTQTNIKEAILPEEEILPERRNDWKEVNNKAQFPDKLLFVSEVKYNFPLYKASESFKFL